MEPLRIAAMAGSLRRGSLNRRLLETAIEEATRLDGRRVEVDLIDLRTLPLPLYDADLQIRDGIPAAAQQIHDRVATSDALLLANPEYNGGYPALFKNMVDWVSRVDMFVFHPRYVGLLSATPGKGGGVRGIEHVRDLLTNIFVTSHDDAFSLPGADAALADDDTEVRVQLRSWLEGFVAAAEAHRAERAAA